MGSDEQGIRSQAIDLLLGRGVQFDLPAPPLIRWLVPRRCRRLTIRHLKAGTILEIERLALRHKLSDEPFNPRVEVLAEVLAVAILNSRWRIPLFRQPLKHWLLWGVASESLLELFAVTRSLCRVEDFTAFTIWTMLTANLTAVRMGQEEGGS